VSVFLLGILVISTVRSVSSRRLKLMMVRVISGESMSACAAARQRSSARQRKP